MISAELTFVLAMCTAVYALGGFVTAGLLLSILRVFPLTSRQRLASSFAAAGLTSLMAASAAAAGDHSGYVYGPLTGIALPMALGTVLAMLLLWLVNRLPGFRQDAMEISSDSKYLS